MSVPFVIEMKPHPITNTMYGRHPATHWVVTRANRWIGDFESFGKAQLFVNAMAYIEEVKPVGHLDAFPAYGYLLRNIVSLE